MRLYISPMTEPMNILKNKINTICVENTKKFRDIVLDFLEENENHELVFSLNYEPFSMKGNVCFVSDYFNFQVSPAIVKKIYNYLENLCVSELPNESESLKADITGYLAKVSQLCDFDFDYRDSVSLCDVFKMRSLKPQVKSFDTATSLLNYIIVINQYAHPKCFVLLNMHLFFSNEEIELLFQNFQYQGIYVILLENAFSFEKLTYENVFIIDKDLCEIVANDSKI